MKHVRAWRAAATLFATLGLLTGALAAPGITAAKTPSWVGSITSLPPMIQAGAAAGYELTITNKGPSNISQLYLFTVHGAPDVAYVSDPRCNQGGQLYCSFGSLPKRQSITLTVAFPTPAQAAGTFSADFEWNTTGLGSGGGDNSHGDALSITGSTALSADAQNFIGGFLLPTSNTVLANNQSIDSGNPQASTLYAPTTGIGASVGDGDLGECPAGFVCFGQATRLVVGDGSTKYGMFKLVVLLDSSIIPNNKSASNVGVVHVLDNGAAQDITGVCPASGVPTSPCIGVEELGSGGSELFSQSFGAESSRDDDCDDHQIGYSSGRHHHHDDCPPPPQAHSDLQVTIWLDQNGFVKFH